MGFGPKSMTVTVKLKPSIRIALALLNEASNKGVKPGERDSDDRYLRELIEIDIADRFEKVFGKPIGEFFKTTTVFYKGLGA